MHFGQFSPVLFADHSHGNRGSGFHGRVRSDGNAGVAAGSEESAESK